MRRRLSARRESAAAGAPIFVLAAPRSHSALIGAMLGCNPAAFGVAELNLFVADTLEDAWVEMAVCRQGQMHGLLRTVAQLFAGEQSLAAVAMARRWMMRRLHWPSARVFEEICARAAPFRVVEKSRAHLRDPECLARTAEACPEACYVHIVRHPRAQGLAMAEGGEDDAALVMPVLDLLVQNDTPKPDELWAAIELRIASFLATIPPERQMRIRAEDVIAAPETQLAAIAAALGLPADKNAVAAMLHPEASPFAAIGPLGANFGDDPDFLRRPSVPSRPAEATSLEGPLPWRPGGAGFADAIAERARGLGYS